MTSIPLEDSPGTPASGDTKDRNFEITHFGAPKLRSGKREDGTEGDGTSRNDWSWPAREGVASSKSLADLAAMVARPLMVASKYEAPLWSGATFNGGHHTNEAFQQADVLALDVENGATVEEASSALQSAWHAIYTTWGHDPASPRYRIVLPLSRPVDGAEYRRLIRVLSDRVTGVDPACKKLGCWVFGPCQREGYTHEVHEATLFDVDAALAEGGPHTPGEKSAGSPGGGVTPGSSDLDPKTSISAEDDTYTALEWAGLLAIDEKEQVYCPLAEDSTLGAAFLRRYDGNLLLCCTSQNHGHEAPYKATLQLPRGEVGSLLRRGKHGPKTSRLNLVTILEKDSAWAQRFWQDDYRRRTMLDDALLTDADEVAIAVKVEADYDLEFRTSLVHEAVVHVAGTNARDPLVEYLDALEWDEEKRIEHLARVLSTQANEEYTHPVLLAWMTGAVARVYDPGCKMDLTLILQGPEACGKSSALEALAGVEWFSDSPLPLGHPGDLVEALGSAWVHELPELDGIRKRQVTQVKAFLTATSDRGRPAYGRNIVEAPRRCVFAGSTNEAAFLPSDTGNRRFWVIPVRKSIDVAWITSNRAALWAEAVHHFKTDGKWWFGREIEAHLDAQCTSLFREADPFEEPIEDYLESHPGPLLLADILNLVGTSRNKRQEADRVTRILRQRGYERPKSSWWHGGRKARWWRGP